MGFLQLRRQYQISHEVRRGAQRASRAAPGKSGLHARGEGVVGFLQLRRQYQISHEVQRGAQRASRAAPGKSGLHARGEGERVRGTPGTGEPGGLLSMGSHRIGHD